jgi:hypothetical protein
MKSFIFILFLISHTFLFRNALCQTPFITANFPVIADSFCTAGFRSAAPLITDLNLDGKKEIIVAVNSCYPSRLHVIQSNGQNLPGFPVTIWGKPLATACGDINGNGLLEIVIRQYDSLIVITNDGDIMSGFPIYFRAPDAFSIVSIYDLDNDGKLEIITYGNGNVGVFNFNGTMKQGWPVTVIGTPMGSISIGDLDNDGFAEIIFPSASRTTPPSNGRLNIYRYNGTNFPNWPQLYDSNYSSWFSGAAVKINKNNIDSTTLSITSKRYSGADPDLNRTTVYDTYGNIKIRFYDTTYNPLNGVYPVNIITSLPGDEYCTGSQDPQIYLHGNNGMLLPDWPQRGYGLPTSPPLFGKVVLSEGLKIITTENWTSNSNGFIYGYNGDGSQLPWSPLRPLGVVSSIAFTDFENDGNAELVAVTNQFMRAYIHCYTFPGVAFTKENFTWTMYGHDRYRTFQYGFIPPDEPIGILPISNIIPDRFILDQNYPNPFNPATNIKFSIPASHDVKIAVYDILGRELTVLVNEKLMPGEYNVSWDASGFSSGIYFYKLEAGSFIATKKMILMK